MKSWALVVGCFVAFSALPVVAAEEPAVAGDPVAAMPSPEDPGAAAAAPAAPEAAQAGEATPPAAPPSAAPAPREPHRVTLGAIGHDDQGREGRIHTVARGDTLWDISDAYLGTPWVWPSIWRDNQAIANPHLIRPGDRIWITPTEMRRISEAEAARMLAQQPAAEGDAPPASLADAGSESGPGRMLRFSAIETVGLLTPEQIAAASSVVESPSDRQMLGDADPIVLGLGQGEVKVGDQFTLFRVREAVYDPDTRRMLGHFVQVLGWAEVREVHPESSLATIRASYYEIERGDRVLRREPTTSRIALRPGRSDIAGKIVFLPNSRTTMGTQDIVYLNRGSDDGLQVGNELEVYREMGVALDAVRDANVQVPDDVLAKLVVVSVQSGSAVAFVEHASRDLERGDKFRSASARP